MPEFCRTADFGRELVDVPLTDHLNIARIVNVMEM
jgi:hypothetical protein